MGIPDFISCRNPGPERSMAVERLTEHPLRGFPLPITHAEIIADAISEYGRRSIGSADMLHAGT